MQLSLARALTISAVLHRDCTGGEAIEFDRSCTRIWREEQNKAESGSKLLEGTSVTFKSLRPDTMRREGAAVPATRSREVLGSLTEAFRKEPDFAYTTHSPSSPVYPKYFRHYDLFGQNQSNASEDLITLEDHDIAMRSLLLAATVTTAVVTSISIVVRSIGR